MAKEAFAKIKTTAKINDFHKKKGGVDLKFHDMKITGSQYERLSDMMDDGQPVTITIEVKQATLPGTT